jgi:hypothetical protein
MTVELVKTENGYELRGSGGFVERHDFINEAMASAEEMNLDVVENEITIGFKLGGYAVLIHEGKLDLNKIRRAMLDSTDPAWEDAIDDLGIMLREAAAGRS